MARLAAIVLAGLAAFAAVPLASAGNTIRVSVAKLAFSPAQINAHVGDTIEWASTDVLVHTATARNRDWDVSIPAKGSGRLTLTKRGSFDYYCRFHPNMTGKIVVE